MHPKIYYAIFLLCSLVMLADCGPRFTPARDPGLAAPQLNEASFISFDGTELPLRTWLPPGGMDTVRFILIAVHGFNDYSNFIKKSALYFANHNIVIYAYDQRGFGNAPVRGRWSSTRTMTMDLETLIRLMAQKHPGLPVYLLGHSMGGAVIIQALASRENSDVSGSILVAPAVWSRATMPFYQTWALWLVAHTIPWYTVTGETLGRKACSDAEALKELDLDPLVIKETRFDTIYGLQNLMDAAFANADRFDHKTLVLYGHHDEIIPREPVLEVFKRFPARAENQKQLILYENGYHMLLRDLHAEDVMKDIVAWINNNALSSERRNK